MESYLINDLERLTGIKAHTIRIWEKRYGLITPERTESNRRYYNDEQVRKLLNVTTLLAGGGKISKIATLSEDEINNKLLSESNEASTGDPNAAYINDLIKCMLAFDETGFEKIFSAAVIRFGVYESMIKVVYPFLNKAGILWSVNKNEPVQEHFASCIIRRKLMAAIDGLLPPVKKGKKFLLFLPPGEWHEIGLLFANYIIRSKGYSTVYLGQNMPFENISKIAKEINFQYMLLFYVAARPKEELVAQLKAFAGIDSKIQVLVAGNNDLLQGSKLKTKNVTWLPDVNSLSTFL